MESCIFANSMLFMPRTFHKKIYLLQSNILNKTYKTHLIKLNIFRKFTVKRIAEKKVSNKNVLRYKLHICSENNFPTAAGLASSAAGYACLVYTLAALYGIEKEELSVIARIGSGSACRSIYGGFVHWQKGTLDDGSDSRAVQIVPDDHWPEMHVIILVVNDQKKKVGSSLGMARSVLNSAILKYRASDCVPSRVTQIRQVCECYLCSPKAYF